MIHRFAALVGLAALSACATPSVAPDDVDARDADPTVAEVERAADLVGLSEGAVRRALGAPDRTRPEGAVAIWRYNADACVVDLFFYPDAPGLRVRHAEARNAFGAAADDDVCFDELRERASLTS